MKVFDDSMKAFSKGVGESGKIDRQNRKNLESINGKSKKSLRLLVWNEAKKDVSKSSKKEKHRAPDVDELFWGTKEKQSKRSKSVKEAVWGSNSKVKLM